MKLAKNAAIFLAGMLTLSTVAGDYITACAEENITETGKQEQTEEYGTADSAEDITDMAEEIADSAEDITDSAEDITDPTEDIADPTEDITDPTEDITDPAENIADPTDQENAEGLIFSDESVSESDMPAQDFCEKSASGITVEAEVEEGVFAAGTIMTVTDVAESRAIEIAQEALQEENTSETEPEGSDMGNVVVDAVAVDISFTDADGNEIEPEDGENVHVTITLPESEKLEGDEYTLLHVDDEGETTEVVADAMSSSTIVFDGEEFSIYVISSEKTVSYGYVWLEGSCGKNGDNVTFKVVNKGLYAGGSDLTLVISGTGAMADYDSQASQYEGKSDADTTYVSKAPWAFTSAYNTNNIKHVVIEPGVTSIGDYAFYNLPGLDDIALPDTLTSIGNAAFRECKGISGTLTIPDSVSYIGGSAFFNCDGLTSVTVPKNLTSDGGSVFACCDNLTSVTIPSGCTKLGEYMFGECTALSSVTVPASVTSIGTYAFYGCSGLTTIDISGVTSIGPGAFEGCIGLTGVSLNEGISTIAFATFRNCVSLTSVNIPANVSSIQKLAFMNCTGITSVTIADGSKLTTIGESAFNNCSKLKELTIQENDSTVSIAGSAFNACTSLEKLVLPSCVTSIAAGAMTNCSSDLTIYTSENSVAHVYAVNNNIKYVLDRTSTYIEVHLIIPVSSKLYFTNSTDGYKSNTEAVTFRKNGTTYGNLAQPATYDGYEFDGYYTNSDYTGDPITSTTVANDSDGDGIIRVYAKWKYSDAPHTIRIVYKADPDIGATSEGAAGVTYINKNGEQETGKNVSVTSAYYTVEVKYPNTQTTISINKLDENSIISPKASSDYTFMGWMVNGDSSKLYEVGDTVTVGQANYTKDQEISVRPYYELNMPYYYSDLAYRDASGDSTVSNMPDMDIMRSIVYDKSMVHTVSSTVPTRKGYTFRAWILNPRGTPSDYDSGKIHSTNDGDYSSQYEGYIYHAGDSVTISSQSNYKNGISECSEMYALWSVNKYTNALNYDANGGTGAPRTQTGTVTYPNTTSDFTVSNAEPAREGYVFQGWYTSAEGGVKADAGSTYRVGEASTDSNQSVTLYAHWNAAYTNTLKYDANGGSGAPDSHSEIVEYPNTSYLCTVDSTTVPDRTGYTFLGWYTSAEGGSKISGVYPIGDYDETSDQTITVYAHWKADTYSNRLKYDANGGAGAPEEQMSGVTYPDTACKITVSTVHPARTGYTFAGWYTEAAGGTEYTAGSSYTVGESGSTADQSATLYAHWTAETYRNTLKYDANGGTGTPKEQTVAATYPDTACKITVSTVHPVRTGYTFAGWYTEAAGGTEYTAGSSYTVGESGSTADQSATLYAHWNQNKISSENNTKNKDVTDKKDDVKTRDISSFTDVSPTKYYASAITWAVENNITNGTGENTISPDEVCTRAQAITLLWRANGSPEVNGTSRFKDVQNEDSFYYKAVVWAENNNIVFGTSKTTFSPSEPLTRGQFVTVLWRMKGMPAHMSDCPFNDIGTGSAFYYDAVLWASQNGITSGTTSTTFSPDDSCTRAQVITLIYRMMGKQ